MPKRPGGERTDPTTTSPDITKAGATRADAGSLVTGKLNEPEILSIPSDTDPNYSAQEIQKLSNVPIIETVPPEDPPDKGDITYGKGVEVSPAFQRAMSKINLGINSEKRAASAIAGGPSTDGWEATTPIPAELPSLPEGSTDFEDEGGEDATTPGSGVAILEQKLNPAHLAEIRRLQKELEAEFGDDTPSKKALSRRVNAVITGKDKMGPEAFIDYLKKILKVGKSIPRKIGASPDMTLLSGDVIIEKPHEVVREASEHPTEHTINTSPPRRKSPPPKKVIEVGPLLINREAGSVSAPTPARAEPTLITREKSGAPKSGAPRRRPTTTAELNMGTRVPENSEAPLNSPKLPGTPPNPDQVSPSTAENIIPEKKVPWYKNLLFWRRKK